MLIRLDSQAQVSTDTNLEYLRGTGQNFSDTIPFFNLLRISRSNLCLYISHQSPSTYYYILLTQYDNILSNTLTDSHFSYFVLQMAVKSEDTEPLLYTRSSRSRETVMCQLSVFGRLHIEYIAQMTILPRPISRPTYQFTQMTVIV